MFYDFHINCIEAHSKETFSVNINLDNYFTDVAIRFMVNAWEKTPSEFSVNTNGSLPINFGDLIDKKSDGDK